MIQNSSDSSVFMALVVVVQVVFIYYSWMLKGQIRKIVPEQRKESIKSDQLENHHEDVSTESNLKKKLYLKFVSNLQF